MAKLKVGTAEANPGEIGFGKLRLEPLPDGGEVFIPVILVNGARPGPVLWLGSDIHGGEIPGIEVTRQITRQVIDPAHLRGAVIGAPILNPYAFRHRIPNAPQDGINLNAVFPGDPEGTISQRIAHILHTQGLAFCDYAIDFHAATPLGMEFMCLPACADPDVMARSLEIALAFGFPLVELTRDMFGYDHSLVGWAQDHGKPGFVCEVKAQQRYFRSSIPHGVRGVLNVMKCIGMVDGEIEPQIGIPGAGGTYQLADIRSRRSGLALFGVAGGQRVSGGEEIGVIRDLWGNELDRLRSPADGYVRSITDNQVVFAGEIVGTILEPHPREQLWLHTHRS